MPKFDGGLHVGTCGALAQAVTLQSVSYDDVGEGRNGPRRVTRSIHDVGRKFVGRVAIVAKLKSLLKHRKCNRIDRCKIQ